MIYDALQKVWGRIRQNSGVLFLAVIISGCFFSFYVDNIAMNFYPEKSTVIQVKVYFSEKDENVNWIELRDYVSDEELWKRIDEADKTQGWQNKIINNCRRWTVVDVDEPEIITFQVIHPGKIDFACGGGKGIVEISCNGETNKYDLLENEGDTILPVYRKFSSQTCRMATIINCFFFVLAFLITFMFLKFFIYAVSSGIFVKGIAGRKYGAWTLGVVFALFLIWAFVGYVYGIEQYTTGYGDQGWYWNQGWSVNPFITTEMIGAKFRGYLTAWVCVVFIRIGDMIGVPGEIFWIVYLCLMHAWVFGYAMPRICELLSGKKVKLYQIILMVTMYLIFWGYAPMAKASDAAGMCFFFLAVWALLEFKENRKLLYAFLGGFFSAASISYRMAYKHGLYGFAVLLAVLLVYRLMTGKSIDWKKYTAGLAIFLIGLVLVSSPQLYGNLKSGVISCFPYNPATDGGISFAAQSASAGLRGSLVFSYPYGAYDQSFFAMSERFGLEVTDEGWSMETILCLFSSQWMDTMIYIVKKLFFGMSMVKSFAYGSLITGYAAAKYPFAHTTEFVIVPMINYLSVGACIYSFIFLREKIGRKERFFWITAFITLVLPQTLTHVENRYFIIGHIMVYYFAAFYLADSVGGYGADSKSVILSKSGRFALFEGVFLLAAQVLFWTFY